MSARTRCRLGLVALALLVLTCAGCGDQPSSERGFSVRGVIEGFYGPLYPHEARLRLIRFMGERGMNTYVYAPKLDPKHRDEWREPYDDSELARFAELARVGADVGVRFVFAISPGLSYDPSDPRDFALLEAKLRSVVGAGAGGVALLFDDLLEPGARAIDPSVQARLLTRTRALVESLPGGITFWFIGNVYAGPIDDLRDARGFYGGFYPFTPRQYFDAYNDALPLRVPTMWTGLGVFARTIRTVDAQAFRAFVGGRQVIAWDNFPVNDTLATSLFLCPYSGRDADLPSQLDGIVLNLMNQPAATLVPVATAAAYLRAPQSYDPDRAWDDAVADVGGRGADAFRLFALQHHGHPALDGATEAIELGRLVTAYASAEPPTQPSPSPEEELRAYLERLVANRSELLRTIDDPQLLADIEPWSSKLTALATAALAGLDAASGGGSLGEYQRLRDAARESPYLVAADRVGPPFDVLVGGGENPPVDRFADLFAAIERGL